MKTDQQATAADFEPYVAELRAEGMTDAEIVERWMRQARPEAEIAEFHRGMLSLSIGDLHLTYSQPDGNSTTEEHYYSSWSIEENRRNVDDLHGDGHAYSLEPALAWLASQLAERCPISVRSETVHELWKTISSALGHPASWMASNDPYAARIRRMFAIAEPGEVTT